MDIARRLGIPPQERGSITDGTCPDVFELADGSFAFIGRDVTADLDGKLPPDAARADYESIVRIPRQVMIAAKKDIPDE